MLGEIIKGRYQVVQILSSSSYCQTYLAHDVSQNQLTACVIKHLLPAENQNTSSLSTLRRLFTREVAALEKLGTYPQVPQLLDQFEENQQFYLVLEYVAGQPLSTLLPPGARWSEKQTIELLYEVLSILEVVHAHGLIHRDIKPSNLIQRASDGLLVLIDFGSVKQAWTQVVTSHGQTNANYAIGIPATVAIGTPGYMPSEQSRGRPRPNSDIYALGMIGIQALTGMQPTLLLEDAETGEVIWQNLAVVSPELAAILNQMVRYHFSERYQTATEVLAALQPLATELVPEKFYVAEVAPESSPSKSSVSSAAKSATTRSKRRQNLALWLGIVLGIISALALILGSYYILRPAPKESSAVNKSHARLTSNTANAKVFKAQTLLGHTNSVWAIATSSNGRILVSGSEDNTIKVWDLTTNQLLRSLSGHTDTVRTIAIDPNGSTLASGSGDKNIRLWNWQTGKQLGTLRGNTGPIWSIAISRDSQALVSGGEDGTVRLWNFQTGELLRAISAHAGRVFSVALSPNGQICATGGIDRKIKIWNVQTGQLLHVLKGHTDVVRAVSFSPDGRKLASSSWDKTVKIWNWQTEEQLYTLKGHAAKVISVAFSSDGTTLASASNDRTIKIWNVQAGRLLQTLIDHQDWVLAVVTSPNQTLVSSSKDNTIKVWQQ